MCGLHSAGQRSEIKVSQGHAPSQLPRANSIERHILQLAGNPWCFLAWWQSSHDLGTVSLSFFLACVPSEKPISIAALFLSRGGQENRPGHSQDLLLITSVKTLFPSKLTFQGAGLRFDLFFPKKWLWGKYNSASNSAYKTPINSKRP